MGDYSVPKYIRDLKPKGTIVKKIKSHYYVYEYFSVKNPETGKFKNKSGKELGTIDPELGFIPNSTYNARTEISVLDYGQYALVYFNSLSVFERLKNIFNPLDALRIYVLALIHYVHGYVPLTNIAEIYEQSWLSIKHENLKMGYTALAHLLSSLGRQQNNVVAFSQRLIDESSGKIAIDGHAIPSTSDYNDLSEKGNKYLKFGEDQINVMVAYDIETQIPLVSKIFEGGKLDKTSVSDLLNMYKFNKTLFIVDRGFYSKDNIDMFSSNGNQYIIPLSTNLIDYKNIMENNPWENIFVYECRTKADTVEYHENIIENRRIIAYKDVNQNALERHDYYTKVQEGKKGYTVEKYNALKDSFGVIVLQTNIMNETTEEIFKKYKSRWKIETYFNYVKNDMEFKDIGASDYYVEQGLSFIMLIVGLIKKEFSDKAKEVKGKSNEKILLEGNRLKIMKIDNKWMVSKPKDKTNKLFKQLNIDLTAPEKYIKAYHME